jgi:hypothetical protein
VANATCLIVDEGQDMEERLGPEHYCKFQTKALRCSGLKIRRYKHYMKEQLSN